MGELVNILLQEPWFKAARSEIDMRSNVNVKNLRNYRPLNVFAGELPKLNSVAAQNNVSDGDSHCFEPDS